MRKLFIIPFFVFSLLTSPAQMLPGGDAAKRITHADEVLLDNNTGYPKFIHFNSESNLYLENFDFWAADNLGLKNKNRLVLIGTETDALGMVHNRYQQYFNEKPVQYSMIIVHSLNGKVVSVNGEYYPNLSDNFRANLNEAEALHIALDKVSASVYAWQDLTQEAIIKYIKNNSSSTYYPKGELVYVSKNNSLLNGDFRLAYKFDVYSSEPLSRANIYVDAGTGEILFVENLIHTSNVIGTAHTKYSGVRLMTTDSTGPGNYRLRETGRGLGVETYNFKKGTSTFASVDFTDADNDWNNINAAKDEVATDAHWGAEKTYDYYKNTYNRNSIDNNGFKLLSYVHYSTNYNNAYWNNQYMTYGDGDGIKFNPLTALDVCGHEITHGLTSKTANLVYQDEPGGLNESFSDIFGTTIEFYGRNGSGNWLIGEDIAVSSGALRSMQNPKLYNNPNTYLKTSQYWVPAGGPDNGGVHTNSGVQNYWYYLMCQGGSGTNDNFKAYNVPGMGMLKAAAITYRSLTLYLTPNTKYSDARFYSIQAAKDLFGACSQEVKITTNTWAAVGVGDDFDSVVKAGFMSNDTLICGSSGTAKFINTSNGAVSYLWDFGDGGSSTLFSPSHFYATQGNYTVKLKVSGCNTPITFDSITKVSFIIVSANNPICLAQKMPSGTGTGSVITLCSGKLMDDGGLGNYSDRTNSKRTISTSSVGYLRIKFNSFSFENQYDYLYIYDGPTSSSPLIGKYTGDELPNGGTIVTTQGAVTFVQSTDQYLTESGFDLDWQCFVKSPNDVSVIAILPIKTMRQFTPGFTDSSKVNVIIRNNGTVAQSNIPLNYSVNGGTVFSTIAPPLLLPNEIDTLMFTTPIANNIGTYKVKVYSTLPTDSIKFNDTAVISFRIIENNAVTLPFIEGFEGMGADSSNKNVFSLKGAGKMDYENNDSFNLCRFRTQPFNITPYGGSNIITFDRTENVGDVFSNFLTLTLNLSNYLAQKVYFEFYYKSHGDEPQANDRVWIRGNMNNNWIEVYNLIPNAAVTPGKYIFVTGLRLDSLLGANAQSLSTNTQIRWGQQDNRSAESDTTSDGISFDDIRVYQPASSGINSSATGNESLVIYPNPARNEFIVSGIHSLVTITLMDVAGKVISVTSTDKNISINSSGLADGIYLLNIANGNMNITKKLIIQ